MSPWFFSGDSDRDKIIESSRDSQIDLINDITEEKKETQPRNPKTRENERGETDEIPNNPILHPTYLFFISLFKKICSKVFHFYQWYRTSQSLVHCHDEYVYDYTHTEEIWETCSLLVFQFISFKMSTFHYRCSTIAIASI